jgi:AcrR family transcriptional regulator
LYNFVQAAERRGEHDVSPQRSNRANLIDGTLRCLDRMPHDRITARTIAAEAGANLASITYHFESKDNLLTEAMIAGLDRWLAEIAARLGELSTVDPAERYRRAAKAMEATRDEHLGLARLFFAAVAKAPHDPQVRELLATGFARTRPTVATLLGLGSDRAGEDAGGLVLGLFYGLLLQVLLDPALAIEGKRLERAHARLRTALPEQ